MVGYCASKPVLLEANVIGPVLVLDGGDEEAEKQGCKSLLE